MPVEIEIKLRLLEKPNDLSCAVEYSVPSSEEPLYRVCISNNLYVIYDVAVMDEKFIKEIEKLRDKLYDVIVGDVSISDFLDRIRDPRLKHIVERQYAGYGVLEAFLADPNIINVHVMPGKPVQVIHKEYGRLQTNVVLSMDETAEIAMRIAAAAGKPLSEAIPLASFIEPRYDARVTVIYQSDVTLKRGMVIDIRKPPSRPMTILKLIKLGSLSIEEAAFLWLMIKYRAPVIIVGEVFTGKTTLATALASLIPPGARILTAEDAPEFRIPAMYWVRTTTREYGEYTVTYFDLLKTGVRLSLDYIIIGEIRGEEAREWAQSILLGHGAITTFHAESPEAALLRLLAPPISIDPQVVKLLNVFVKTNVVEKEPGVRVFRHEVFLVEEGMTKPLFIYDKASDKIVLSQDIREVFDKYKFIDRITLAHHVTRGELYQEYLAMVKALEEALEEAAKTDPTLETPLFTDIPKILYSKLEKYKTKVL
ncbi:MAG: type II/IV secretion system ATPase subunit [Desulfurococcaceae archaeon]